MPGAGLLGIAGTALSTCMSDAHPSPPEFEETRPFS